MISDDDKMIFLSAPLNVSLQNISFQNKSFQKKSHLGVRSTAEMHAGWGTGGGGGVRRPLTPCAPQASLSSSVTFQRRTSLRVCLDPFKSQL